MTTVEMFAIEEVSSCAAQASRRLFKSASFGAADLLHVRLDEEADRFVVEEWTDYKAQLRKVEALLLDAGVPGHMVRHAIGDLDEQAIGLYVCGQVRMLNLGLDIGRKLATGQPFVITLPPKRSREGKSLGESEPALMLAFIPDET